MRELLIVAATVRELCGEDGLVCGVGPVEAAAATAASLAETPTRAVLHVGIAGARGVAAGSLVIATEEEYGDLAAMIPVVDRVRADPGLLVAAASALHGAQLLPIHTSAGVGAHSVGAPLPQVEAMEGFGVLRAAQLAGVPAVEVRAISNEIGEEDRTRWHIDEALASLADALPRLLVALRGS
jgi:futalosine hydrolase